MRKKRRKIESIIAILAVSGVLTACDQAFVPKVPMVPLETTGETSETGENGVTGHEEETYARISDPTLEGQEIQNVTPTPVPGTMSHKPVNPKKIASRVLKRFQNQCLEWYYSNCFIRGHYQNGAMLDISPKPGDKLYYRIMMNEEKTIYQVQCSPQEDFDLVIEWSYEYSPERDSLTRSKHAEAPEQEVSSGSFVISETLSAPESSQNEAITARFKAFWDDWKTNRESAELAVPVKNAYLMPFSIEDDGKALLCIYLEQENGTWLLSRASVDRNVKGTEAESETGINWGDTLFGSYTMMSYGGWNKDSREPDAVSFPEDMELYIGRAYVPMDGEYAVYVFENYPVLSDSLSSDGPYGNENQDDRYTIGSLWTFEDDTFISAIPEMAVTKLE